MEAMRVVCLASRSKTTRWHTMDLSRKARRSSKVSENGQNIQTVIAEFSLFRLLLHCSVNIDTPSVSRFYQQVYVAEM